MQNYRVIEWVYPLVQQILQQLYLHNSALSKLFKKLTQIFQKSLQLKKKVEVMDKIISIFKFKMWKRIDLRCSVC